jgi:hypothetical protein
MVTLGAIALWIVATELCAEDRMEFPVSGSGARFRYSTEHHCLDVRDFNHTTIKTLRTDVASGTLVAPRVDVATG